MQDLGFFALAPLGIHEEDDQNQNDRMNVDGELVDQEVLDANGELGVVVDEEEELEESEEKKKQFSYSTVEQEFSKNIEKLFSLFSNRAGKDSSGSVGLESTGLVAIKTMFTPLEENQNLKFLEKNSEYFQDELKRRDGKGSKKKRAVGVVAGAVGIVAGAVVEILEAEITEAQLFLNYCFNQLHVKYIRKRIMKFISISCLLNLDPHCLEFEMEKRSDELEKLISTCQKIYQESDEKKILELQFDMNLISTLCKLFINRIQVVKGKDFFKELSLQEYFFSFLDLLITFEGTLECRRFFHLILRDHCLLELVKESTLFKDLLIASADEGNTERKLASQRFLELFNILDFYFHFQVDEVTGLALTVKEVVNQHHATLAHLQKSCFLKYSSILEEFIFASIGSLSNSKSLTHHLENLDQDVLIDLGKNIGVRTSSIFEQNTSLSKSSLLHILVERLAPKKGQLELINEHPLYPHEDDIFNELTLPNNHSKQSTLHLPIAKLNTQFLTLHDYLLRNFELFRLESNFGIRQDLCDALCRLQPRFNPDGSSKLEKTVFTGWSRMATPLHQFQIEKTGPSRLTETIPSFVMADITYNLERYRRNIAEEWDSLRPHDSLFLITIEMLPHTLSTAAQEMSGDDRNLAAGAFKRKYGIKYIRGCEIHQIIDDEGQPVFDFSSGKQPQLDGSPPRITGSLRTLRVLMDSNQYVKDLESTKGDVYSIYGSFNLVFRRSASQNNFKAILESIRDLMQSDLVVPDWIHDVLLGYGRRDSAHFQNVEIPTRTIDFGWTFLNGKHLKESFENEFRIRYANGDISKSEGPFIATFPKASFLALEDEQEDEQQIASPKTKGKRGAEEKSHLGNLIVRSYHMPSLISDPKRNTIPFTRSQIQAIRSGSSNGLTLIVGPPGTGKTDVAVQIISNLYMQKERILLITRSNQALNHLFEKISKSNIKSRHLLRLGHGHEELDAASWGKSGRINSFLELRLELLAQVESMAVCLSQSPAHASTCETASYFYSTYIEPVWKPYFSGIESMEKDIKETFPFKVYLDKIKPGVFENCKNLDETRQVVEDFNHLLLDTFDEIEQVRPFELLRSNKERSNYLLVKEARIVAMTSTHASLKRRELVRLGFQYGTVIMEEAGQMLEVETFIPLLLQNHDTDLHSTPLSRVVLIGDHHQLPPIVQSQALVKHASFDQSLFARLIKLGVPTIDLDHQGRSRPSIADLYRWKYNNLQDLPRVLDTKQGEFSKANAGFEFDFQAINVDEFRGIGESCPRPHFIQNLGEAEYVVATYMYMRLLGYPHDKIAILTTYNGQKELIHDVLTKRCSWHPLFKRPILSTVDQFQGQQTDYVLLSLVRTKNVGHIRDVRRLVVALSRARLGLYVFCRVNLFKQCKEMAPAFTQLLKRPTHLSIVSGEKYQECVRCAHDAPEKSHIIKVKNVVDMGERVHRMTMKEVEHLKSRR